MGRWQGWAWDQAPTTPRPSALPHIAILSLREQTPWGFLAVIVFVSPGQEGSTGPLAVTYHCTQDNMAQELGDAGSYLRPPLDGFTGGPQAGSLLSLRFP